MRSTASYEHAWWTDPPDQQRLLAHRRLSVLASFSRYPAHDGPYEREGRVENQPGQTAVGSKTASTTRPSKPQKPKILDEKQLEELRVPGEESLFWLLAVCEVVTLLLFVLGIAQERLWEEVAKVAAILASAVILGWYFTYWYVHGNSIRISAAYADVHPKNEKQKLLQEIYYLVEQASEALQLSSTPSIFVLQGHGVVNSIMVKHFSKRGMIVLTSNLVDDLLSSGDTRQLMMIVGRQLGHVAAGHFRSYVVTELFGSIFLPIQAAYHRRCHLTADRIGLLFAGNLKSARLAMLTLTIGKTLASGVSRRILRDQYGELQDSKWAAVQIFFQHHPYLIERIESLAKFDAERKRKRQLRRLNLPRININGATVGVLVVGDKANVSTGATA